MTHADRVEITVTPQRSDYFWGLLYDGLGNPMLWLALVIPPVAQGVVHFRRTDGMDAATRAVEIAIQVAAAAGFRHPLDIAGLRRCPGVYFAIGTTEMRKRAIQPLAVFILKIGQYQCVT